MKYKLLLVSLFLFGATFAAEQKRSLSDRYCFCYNQQLNIFDEAVLKRAFPDLQKNGDERELLAENFFQEKCSSLSELAALEEKQKSNEKACFLIFKKNSATKAIALVDKKANLLQFMCTHHKERKKGLATSLLGTIEEYIANYKEKKELELTVPGGKNYSKLLSFYQKRGFEVTESQFWQWANMIKTCTTEQEAYGTTSSTTGEKRKASTDPDQ